VARKPHAAVAEVGAAAGEHAEIIEIAELARAEHERALARVAARPEIDPPAFEAKRRSGRDPDIGRHIQGRKQQRCRAQSPKHSPDGWTHPLPRIAFSARTLSHCVSASYRASTARQRRTQYSMSTYRSSAVSGCMSGPLLNTRTPPSRSRKP